MSSPSPTTPNYEQAGELKIGQVGIANLRVRTLDVAALVREMRERVDRAPKLFGRAAVIVDFGGLIQAPDLTTARAPVRPSTSPAWCSRPRCARASRSMPSSAT